MIEHTHALALAGQGILSRSDSDGGSASKTGKSVQDNLSHTLPTAAASPPLTPPTPGGPGQPTLLVLLASLHSLGGIGMWALGLLLGLWSLLDRILWLLLRLWARFRLWLLVAVGLGRLVVVRPFWFRQGLVVFACLRAL